MREAALFFEAAPGDRQHTGRDVDSGDVTGRSNGPGELDDGRPGSETNLEHSFTGTGREKGGMTVMATVLWLVLTTPSLLRATTRKRWWPAGRRAY